MWMMFDPRYFVFLAPAIRDYWAGGRHEAEGL